MGAKTIPFSVFKEKFEKRANKEYEYIKGYKGMSKKILVKHNKCGNEFEVVASAFINTQTNCKKCSDKKINETKIIKQAEKNKKYIIQITNGEYELLEYSGYNKKHSIFKHNICGNIFKSRYEFFVYRGNRCPKCSRKHTRYTIKELKEKFPVKDLEILDISYPGPKIKIKCLKCNTIKHIGLQTYKKYNFKCCKKKMKEEKLLQQKKKSEEKRIQKQIKKESIEQLKNEIKFEKYYKQVESVHGKDIKIKEKVFNTQDKFLIECNICNHIWKSNFKYLRRGHGCPICKSSKGEKAINKYLINKNFVFEREYKFSDSEICSLRFDFAVKLNDKLYLIEFDGEQHFDINKQFGDNNKEEKYNKQITNDNKKNEYCINNNIPLLRIPYWEIDNIDKLLNNFLKAEE